MIEREYPGNHAGTERRSVYSNQWLLQKFYYQLRLIQEIDRRLCQETASIIPGARPFAENRSYGAEVCDVGVINAIDFAKDAVFSTCREHVHSLIYSDDITGYVMRSTYLLRRFQNIVNVPNNTTTTCFCGNRKCKNLELCAGDAISAALMFRLTGSGAISIMFITEEALADGQFNQFFGVASLWSLPILYVLNTSGALTDDSATFFTGQMNLTALEGEQLAAQSIVANDVLKVYAFASAATAYIRSNCRPFLLHLITTPYHETGRSPSDKSSRPVNHSGDSALSKMASKLSPIDQRRIDNTIVRRIETALQEAQFSST